MLGLNDSTGRILVGGVSTGIGGRLFRRKASRVKCLVRFRVTIVHIIRLLIDWPHANTNYREVSEE